MESKRVFFRGSGNFRYLKWEEFLNLIFGYFWGVGFPLHKPIHTAYRGEYLNFRYLKCLVKGNELGKQKNSDGNCVS